MQTQPFGDFFFLVHETCERQMKLSHVYPVNLRLHVGSEALKGDY